MGKMQIGVNLEFIRSSDKGFRVGIETAARLGYQYVEPCVATGYDLLALAGYYHMVSMEDDPLELRGWLDALGLKCSALSAHSPLMRPEVAIPYLTKAIRFAADIGAPVVTTDEGIKPAWMGDKQAFEIMAYTLHQVLPWAERHGVTLGLEPHSPYTVRKETFLRILNLSDSPAWKVNWDTGNFYLGGKDDPYDALEAVADRLCHLHAKDISIQQSQSERGEVTGTPVGCACGEGVVDWKKVLEILNRHHFEGVLCVECGRVDQAERSLKYLRGLIG